MQVIIQILRPIIIFLTLFSIFSLLTRNFPKMIPPNKQKEALILLKFGIIWGIVLLIILIIKFI